MKKALAALAVLALVGAFAAGAAPRHDYALVARDILPPGNFGGANFTAQSTDQAVLYDALTPLFDKVTAKDVTKDFKAEPLWTGKEKAVRTELPGRGVTIKRDTFDVPHVFGKTEADVFYGVGWAVAEDRGLLMELARYPGRLACLDAPGFNAFSVALSGKQFKPSQQAEDFVAKQISWLTSAGAKGKAELADIDAYLAGINAQRKAASLPFAPWTRVDVIATTCLLGARFGAGGGDETRRSEFFSALQAKLGVAKGLSVFNDLRQQNVSAPTTLAKSFPYGPQTAGAPGAGNAVVDNASVQAPSPLSSMSNAVLISAKRSATGHPFMVAGPQLGYFYPEFFWEVDMEGGGVSVRGGSLGHPERPDRARPRLRLVVHLVAVRQHRHVRRDAVRRRPSLPLQGHVHGDDALRRRRAPRPVHRRHARLVLGDGARPGHRLRHRRRQARRARANALDARPRAEGGAGRLRPLDRTPEVGTAVHARPLAVRDVVQRLLRRLEAHRVRVLRAAADPRRRCRPGLPDGGHRRLRLDGLPRAGRAPAGDRSCERPARELEQQAGARLRGRRRQLRVRPDPPLAAPLAGTEGGQEHRARRGEHDEQGRDAGPARSHRVARDQLEARVDACAQSARGADADARQRVVAAGSLTARPERRRQDRRSRRGDPRSGVGEDRRRCARAGARASPTSSRR